MAQLSESCDINVAYQAYIYNLSDERLEAVIRQGEPLVRHFAMRYGCGCSFDDLYQSGMLGLMKATKSYDGRAQFSTWASWCIISEIRHFVRNECVYEEPLAGGETAGGETPETVISTHVLHDEFSENEASEFLQADQSFHLRLEDKIALEQAMLKLTGLQKEVIDALFYRGLTQEQEAARLGLNQRKVSRVKQKGLQILGELINEPNFHVIDNSTSFKKIKNQRRL